jgi:hypothetical protein
MKLPNYPLVKVFWLDSHVTPEWVSIEEIQDNATSLDCVSVGFLVHENKESVTVASHVSIAGRRYTASCDGAMTIPRKAITKMVRLK